MPAVKRETAERETGFGAALTLKAAHFPLALPPTLFQPLRSTAKGAKRLIVGDINRFILREKSACSPKRVQLTTSALRSFLGFLYLRGQLGTPLAASVPTVATWRLSELPQFLEPGQPLPFRHYI